MWDYKRTVEVRMSHKKKFYEKFIKRPQDFLLSLIALIVLSPILLLVAILVRVKLGIPILFKQARPGLNEKIFKMYKFRTMTDEKDANGELLPDSIRLTKFGKVLRATSLDELPELWNIVRGDMAIVGPRPQLVRDMMFFTKEQMRRQSVYPGLTGLAQICGRNNISWEDKFKYDLEYIKDINFFEDMRIIYRTVFKVAKQNDIATDGMETSEDLGDYLLRTSKINNAFYNLKIRKAILTLEDFNK